MSKPIFLFMLMSAVTAFADDNQLAERLNPNIEAGNTVAVDYSDYPTVKLANNLVSLNGADWSALGRKYKAALAGDSLFSVVYLGDSHIQADFGGAVLRSRLSADHPAGRGLLIPFRLAGTNEPFDYSFTTSDPFTASKLMRSPWATQMPFTGIGIQPACDEYTFTVTSQVPSDRLRFHILGPMPDVTAVYADDSLATLTYTDGNCAEIKIDRPATKFDISFAGGRNTVYGGIELLNDSVGVLCHSIGNNGATYSDYSNLFGFGEQLATLHPDLLIIALGTNEAFGSVTEAALTNNVRCLLDEVRRYCPATKILLVGPADCYKRSYRRARKGRRRTSVLVQNTKVATVARTIRLFAESESIPYYNHYAVAGSALSQKKAGLLGRDGVHYTATGYRLWGNLLADAILKVLEQ